ncbi:MAG: methylated-DNA--[protein]-cysteine S-methyltransferase [Candidatus Neomarinimicrobiota bacterium]
MIQYSTFKTPLGLMGAAQSKKGLTHIFFEKDVQDIKAALLHNFPLEQIERNKSALEPVEKQIEEYFLGKRMVFDLQLDLRMPPFYKKALLEVFKIPFGRTATYKDIAERAGNEKAVRAVGSANANNPIPIVIPCHRVLASGGGLGGYSAGLNKKVFLLEMEQAL